MQKLCTINKIEPAIMRFSQKMNKNIAGRALNFISLRPLSALSTLLSHDEHTG